MDRQPSNSAVAEATDHSSSTCSSFSFSSNLQALPLITPQGVFCQTKNPKHKIDIDIHSERSIRLARGAKLANIFSSNSSLDQAKQAANTQTRRPASSFKDLTFFGSGDGPRSGPSSYAGAPHQQSLSLLFLNQGLKSDDLVKLRSGLRLLGLNVTHVPARF